MPGVNDSDLSAIRALQVLEEAGHMWAKRKDAELQMICLTDKYAVLTLCPPNVRLLVARYERSQKIIMGVLGSLVQRIIQLADSEFEMSHILSVLRDANNFLTRQLMSKGFPVHMVEAENLFFRISHPAYGLLFRAMRHT